MSASKLAVIGALLSAMAFPAVARPQQFDLICSGTVETFGLNKDHVTKPWSERISVDLGADAWRDAESQETDAIQKITPDRIVFYDTLDTDPIDQFEIIKKTFWVRRFDGLVEKSMSEKGLSTDTSSVTGKCIPADFTPFPGALF